MSAAWSMFTRIPLRYTVVTVFCLVVVVLLAIGREGLQAIVPAALATLVAAGVLFVPTRRRRRSRTAAIAPAAKAPPVATQPVQTKARVPSAVMAAEIRSAFPAEAGWRAIFGEGADSTMSRLVGWAVTTGEGGAVEVVGLVVDPADPSRVVPASGAVTPEGQTLARYGFKEG